MRRFVIYGPPDSGKTSYVRQHARRGDLVWDFDMLVPSIGFGVSDVRHVPIEPWLVEAARVMREALVEWLRDRVIGDCQVFVIVTDERSAKRIASAIGAALVPM